MSRQVVLDTETTGIEPKEGHRIIEIGCLEIIDRKVTERQFHVYINPQREIEAEAEAVHGISTQFLQDKPLFADIVQPFLEFVQGAELIIHNAPFDVGFINHEFKLLRQGLGKIEKYCTITDTLQLARKQYPGQRNSLDALCKRLHVDNSHRELHGALLDSELLAYVYLNMTGGQTLLTLDQSHAQVSAQDVSKDNQARWQRPADNTKLKVLAASAEENDLHEQMLSLLQKSSGEGCFWHELDETK